MLRNGCNNFYMDALSRQQSLNPYHPQLEGLCDSGLLFGPMGGLGQLFLDHPSKPKPRLICKSCRGKDFSLAPKSTNLKTGHISVATCKCCGKVITMNRHERRVFFGEG